MTANFTYLLIFLEPIPTHSNVYKPSNDKEYADFAALLHDSHIYASPVIFLQ